MVGSMLFAFLAGMYHWWPKMFGKMYSEFWGRVGAVALFIGFNVTFFPQFIMGGHGMMRRYATYPEQFQMFHVVSSIGAYVMAFGLFTTAFTWFFSLKNGKPAPANPWGANTLEWYSPSPPPHDNFPVQPAVSDPYEMADWKFDASIEGWVHAPDPNRKPVAH
jgi:cytochrome c oxidase subunit 1